jgi:hypothetical protein
MEKPDCFQVVKRPVTARVAAFPSSLRQTCGRNRPLTLPHRTE